MKIIIEECETAKEKYNRLTSQYFEIIKYCNGTLPEGDYTINRLRRKYGEPTQELKQMAKDKLEEVLHEYLQIL